MSDRCELLEREKAVSAGEATYLNLWRPMPEQGYVVHQSKAIQFVVQTTKPSTGANV